MECKITPTPRIFGVHSKLRIVQQECTPLQNSVQTLLLVYSMYYLYKLNTNFVLGEANNPQMSTDVNWESDWLIDW